MEQKKVLDQFMSLYEKPTLALMSQMTGIQQTRCFRILNGAELKYSEYLKLKELIGKKSTELNGGLSELTERCLLELSEQALKEIGELCERKLLFKELQANRNEDQLIMREA